CRIGLESGVVSRWRHHRLRRSERGRTRSASCGASRRNPNRAARDQAGAGRRAYPVLPNGKGLVFMQDQVAPAKPNQISPELWLLDLATQETRPLTPLNHSAGMRTFHITPDGQQIVFDRLRENSDIVLIDLPR